MKSTAYDEKEVIDFLSDLSKQLLKWSWEGVAGYDEILEKVGSAYGHEDTMVNMEAQMANIRVGGLSTFVRVGIPGFPALAFTRDVKNMLADILEGKLSLPEAKKTLAELSKKEPPYSPLMVWLGVILISVGFGGDIIGTWEGMLWAGITAMATGLVFLAADRIAGFGKIAQLVATMASGIIVMIAWKFGLTVAAPGLLLVASTFVFLPGDSISTQAYELAYGKWSAGVDRLFYSIMTLVLMATGAFIAVVLTNTPTDELFPTGPASDFPWWATYPIRLLLVIGIGLAFQMDKKDFIPSLLVIWVASAVAQLSTIAFNEYIGTFFATIVGTVMALIIARKPRSISSFVMIIPLVFALSPGSHGLKSFESWISGKLITGIEDVNTLIATILAIGIGMIIGQVIAYPWRWLKSFEKA